jgi:hypothetical protein
MEKLENMLEDSEVKTNMIDAAITNMSYNDVPEDEVKTLISKAKEEYGLEVQESVDRET